MSWGSPYMQTYYNYSPSYGHGLWLAALLGDPLLVAALILWSLAWKGWALWLAGRRGQKIWFIALLIVNTVGILEIIYIFLIAKRRDTIEPENGKAN